LSAAEGASPIGERRSRSNLLANGGFEFAGRLSQPRLLRVPNEGVKFENADPLLPVRWTWAGGGRPELRLVSEAHSGQRAVRAIAPVGAWLQLNMSLIEVVPNATYEFGVWTRGSGKGAIAVYGNAFEGRQELAREALIGTSAWSESRRGSTIPGHIRTISVELTAWGECDLTWDDLYCSAELTQPFDPDAVLHRKLSADENTIALVDFDRPGSYRLEGGAKLTDDDGGRFGNGLQLDRKFSSSATVPLSLDRMPDEGTLEFWFAPDEVPEHIHCYCVLLAGDTDVLKLQADTSDSLRLSWRTSAGIYVALGYRVEGLCFLHGLIYGGDGQEVGLYQIEYADGTMHEISLVTGENIRDWVSAPAHLPREKGTQSRIVWTGTTKVFPVTSVWQMLWVNPQPEVPVKSVCFANPKRAACPILIAATAVVPDEKAVADRTAAKARAKQLLEQGLAAFNAGRDTEARDLLKKALSEDGTLHAAHLALANVYEKLQDEDGALATYRAWAKTGAKTPLPYNRLGEILQKRKDYRGALDAYVRSLQVEWNQPPIIEARKRLEKLSAQ
jgi:hypothetical protein